MTASECQKACEALQEACVDLHARAGAQKRLAEGSFPEVAGVMRSLQSSLKQACDSLDRHLKGVRNLALKEEEDAVPTEQASGEDGETDGGSAKGSHKRAAKR